MLTLVAGMGHDTMFRTLLLMLGSTLLLDQIQSQSLPSTSVDGEQSLVISSTLAVQGHACMAAVPMEKKLRVHHGIYQPWPLAMS